MKPSISLIGAGAAGSALVIALSRKGYPIATISSRRLESAQACAALCGAAHATSDNLSACRSGDILILATPDRLITPVCEALAQAAGFTPAQLVLHLSGALSSDCLSAAATAGADTCAMHPLQTLAQPLEGARLLETAWFCLEGEAPAVARARELVEQLSGRVLTIAKQQRTLYHAALCVASNYLVVLEQLAVDMLIQAGVEQSAALPALMPLIRGTTENLAACGLPNALTGPISRGDAVTVEAHLHMIQQRCPSYLPLYRDLGRQALRIAAEKGRMTQEGAARLTDLLLENAENIPQGVAE